MEFSRGLVNITTNTSPSDHGMKTTRFSPVTSINRRQNKAHQHGRNLPPDTSETNILIGLTSITSRHTTPEQPPCCDSPHGVSDSGFTQISPAFDQ
ncbi:hypothetical protein BaRGS_00022534 [Batillaria attramentaria]|uniref:Uncharacterized protein n=1 Tax=Batillaria attramentaria TaxID=370345 RepID=A0ABD0KGP5_9CAEN